MPSACTRASAGSASGEIPDYALWPGGGLVATIVFYKRIGSGGAAVR